MKTWEKTRHLPLTAPAPLPSFRGARNVRGRGATSPALADGSRQSEPPLLSYPFPPKPLRPIPLHIRVKLQDGIHGHFHDHDDDWMLERGRGRRTRDTGAETEAVEPAVPLDIPVPRPLPRVKNFDLFSPRPE